MLKVLLIDDDPLVGSTVESMLRRMGHEVRLTRDGQEGLAAFLADRPDIVITDLCMPKIDGIETIQTLRTHAPNMPIVAMTGSADPPALHLFCAAEAFGATAILKKPFSREQLIGALEACVVHG